MFGPTDVTHEKGPLGFFGSSVCHVKPAAMFVLIMQNRKTLESYSARSVQFSHGFPSMIIVKKTDCFLKVVTGIVLLFLITPLPYLSCCRNPVYFWESIRAFKVGTKCNGVVLCAYRCINSWSFTHTIYSGLKEVQQISVRSHSKESKLAACDLCPVLCTNLLLIPVTNTPHILA